MRSLTSNTISFVMLVFEGGYRISVYEIHYDTICSSLFDGERGEGVLFWFLGNFKLKAPLDRALKKGLTRTTFITRNSIVNNFIR